MYFSTLPDTLFVNGRDLQAQPGIIVEHFDGLHSPGTRRGGNDTVPNRRGQLGAPLPLDAYQFAVPITIVPEYDGVENLPLVTPANRRTAMVRNLWRLARNLADGEGLVSLRRRLSNAAGYVETAANGQFVDGLAVETLNVETGRTELNFVNLDGCWYDVEPSTSLINGGVVAVTGHVPTRRMTIDLPGAGVLRNTTLGVSLAVTTACTLDVEAYTATAGIATLKATGDAAWFALRPDNNTVTWSGSGTPAIHWRGAYL